MTTHPANPNVGKHIRIYMICLIVFGFFTLFGVAEMLFMTRLPGLQPTGKILFALLAVLYAIYLIAIVATLVLRYRFPKRLGSEDGYRTHVAAPPDFDSLVDSRLAADWGADRSGWKLSREAGILQQGQTTFVPDFALRHTDGREVLLEIVGFWTPEYLAAKRETLRTFRDHQILLAIPEQTAKTTAADGSVIVYKRKIDPEKVVVAAEARAVTNQLVRQAHGDIP